jgi:HK97 family phage portal protein
VGLWRDFGRDLVRAVVGRPSEDRAITSLPWVAGGYSPSQRVESNALSLIPYFACVRVLAEQISTLPLETFRASGSVLNRIPDSQFVTNPSVVVDPVTWKRQAVISLATKGNAVGLITGFDDMGFVTGLEWIPWNEIHIVESGYPQVKYYWKSTSNYREIPYERIVHLAWFVEPGHVVGLSPIQAFARSIGVGLSAQNYGATWFESGGVPPATFKNVAKTITPHQVDEITDLLVKSLRAGRPLVHGSDWDFNAIQVSPEESQFIQTLRMNATQMAAIFGVPPEWVGGESGGPLTYNTPEMNGLHVYKIVLNPWLTLMETIFSRLRPSTETLLFNPDRILRGDLKTRYEAHEIGIRAGFLTIDEARAIENRAPLPSADDLASTRELVEMVQKIYLGVGTVLTWTEARQILNRSGAGLNESVPDPKSLPAPLPIPTANGGKKRTLPPLADIIFP